MRDDALPSPGLVSGSRQLRWLAAKAISYIDVNKTAAGQHEQALALKAFFTACATAADAFKELIPTNSVNVSITGTAQVGETLTGVIGTWANNPSFTYQWKANGAVIAGATGTTYVPVVGDIGKPITWVVTGFNSAGSLVKTSAATANVIAA